jgi:polyhydroxyalkanoate synthesis regulator phasin
LLPRTNDESRKTISLLFAEVNNAAYSAEAVAESNLEDMIDYQNNRVSDALQAVANYRDALRERISAFESRLPKLRAEIENFFESKH